MAWLQDHSFFAHLTQCNTANGRGSLGLMKASITITSSQVADGLLGAGKRLTVAESCTGGWIAKTLTDLPGSSAWFEYGFTTYGNNAKTDLLGVSPGLIDTFGAVSKEVAEAMAMGALNRSGADLAVAVTGIAGPDGGTADKPVGTVWFAWAIKDTGLHSATHCFSGDRNAVREQTVAMALQGLLPMLGG